MGLPPGIPVALGAGDRPCEVLGSGAAGGWVMVSTGTTTNVSAAVTGRPERVDPRVMCSLHAVEDLTLEIRALPRADKQETRGGFVVQNAQRRLDRLDNTLAAAQIAEKEDRVRLLKSVVRLGIRRAIWYDGDSIRRY